MVVRSKQSGRSSDLSDYLPTAARIRRKPRGQRQSQGGSQHGIYPQTKAVVTDYLKQSKFQKTKAKAKEHRISIDASQGEQYGKRHCQSGFYRNDARSLASIGRANVTCSGAMAVFL